MQDATVIVPALLSAAGLQPPAEEVADMIRKYPAMRAAADRLYAVPGAADESPTCIFSARV